MANRMERHNFTLVNETIGEAFSRRVAESPQAVAVEFEGQKVTWEGLDLLSDWLVKRFAFLGIAAGSRCALWCGNHLQWIIVYLGLQKTGATAILVNPGYLADELYRVLEYAQIEYLFYGETFKGQDLNEIIGALDLQKHPKLRQTIPIELDDAIRFMMDGARNLTAEDYRLIEERKRVPKPSDVACMLFTSGTTSTPKGVMLTHYNLINCARATVHSMRWTEQDKTCVMVPLFHCFGMTSCLLASIISGGGLYIMKYYRTQNALDAIANHGCTVLNGVPSMFLAMIYNHCFDEYDISGLKSGIIAGSAITGAEYQLICEKLQMTHLQMSYGQTETSPGVSFSGYDESIGEKAGNAGVIIPKLDAGICDKGGNIWQTVKDGIFLEIPELLKSTGAVPAQTLAADDTVRGEIMIKGFVVMQGYFNRPKETAEVLGKDGWLHTGDLGFFDKTGHLHVTGRATEMIIRGGENISPGEIEACILELPQIRQVKIVGIAHPVLQEEIAAAVILNKGMQITEDEIKAFVSGRLAKYKVPRHIVFFDEIPMTTSGKVALGKLKELIEEQCRSI